MNEHSLLSAIKEAKEQSKFVVICCDSSRPRLYAEGFIDFVSSDKYLLRSVSVHGRYNGFMLCSLEEVVRIESGGQHEEKLQHLYRVRQQSHPDFLPELGIEADLTRETLFAAQKHDFAVKIVILGNDSRAGWVELVSEDTLTLKIVDDYGNPDGQLTLDFDSIVRVDVDSEYLQDIKLIARWFESEPPL